MLLCPSLQRSGIWNIVLRLFAMMRLFSWRWNQNITNDTVNYFHQKGFHFPQTSRDKTDPYTNIKYMQMCPFTGCLKIAFFQSFTAWSVLQTWSSNWVAFLISVGSPALIPLLNTLSAPSRSSCICFVHIWTPDCPHTQSTLTGRLSLRSTSATPQINLVSEHTHWPNRKEE